MGSLAHAAAAILATMLFQAPLVGTWALPSGKPAAAAEMRVTGNMRNLDVDIVQTTGTMTAPIRKYDLDMTKLMHLVVISDDFSTFMHVHPAFDAATGHFTQNLTLDPHRHYLVYVDTEPAGLGQQVFRFSLQDGTQIGHATAVRQLPSSPTVTAGPYTVTLSSTTLAANKPQDIQVDVMRGAKPARDLKPYLGAAAHAVFVNTGSLAYIHVHPTVFGTNDDDAMDGMDMSHMDMGPAKSGPKMVMHIPALPAGSYKLWLQFQGDALEVAPFTLAVR